MRFRNAHHTPLSPEAKAPMPLFRAAIFVLLLVIGGGTAIRICSTFSNPAFDFEHPEGLLMSDPALLFYLTKQIVEANGFPPGDFRADRRVEHPDPADLPAMFTVGQEFYLA